MGWDQAKLSSLGDVVGGVAQGAQLTAIGQWDGTTSLSVEPELPASLRRQVDQLREFDGQSPSIDVPDVGTVSNADQAACREINS
jgi:hypothetical protein